MPHQENSLLGIHPKGTEAHKFQAEVCWKLFAPAQESCWCTGPVIHSVTLVASNWPWWKYLHHGNEHKLQSRAPPQLLSFSFIFFFQKANLPAHSWVLSWCIKTLEWTKGMVWNPWVIWDSNAREVNTFANHVSNFLLSTKLQEQTPS